MKMIFIALAAVFLLSGCMEAWCINQEKRIDEAEVVSECDDISYAQAKIWRTSTQEQRNENLQRKTGIQQNRYG